MILEIEKKDISEYLNKLEPDEIIELILDRFTYPNQIIEFAEKILGIFPETQWQEITESSPSINHVCLITDGDYIAVAVRRNNGLAFWGNYGFSGEEWEWDFVPKYWKELPNLP
ncbi:MAG: hypothetical protein ACFFDN_09175 [Candidatus Hodarchaeota archaeon]